MNTSKRNLILNGNIKAKLKGLEKENSRLNKIIDKFYETIDKFIHWICKSLIWVQKII